MARAMLPLCRPTTGEPEREDMKAEDRTKNLMTLLGWQGGTIHDACGTLGIHDANAFLYGPVEFDNDGPSFEFRRGYGDACKYKRAPWSDLVETVEYWLGAVCAVENEFRSPGLNN